MGSPYRNWRSLIPMKIWKCPSKEGDAPATTPKRPE